MPSVLPHITLETAPEPLRSIIWLHGLGADGNDFVPIAEELNLPIAVRFIFPHAPKQAVTINGGLIMRSWYDILATDIGSQQDDEGIRHAQFEIEKLISQERARGIPFHHIFLAGFSQGGAVVLHTGLRQSEQLGGIIALSTYLPLADTVPAEMARSASNTPIFMAHGRNDPIVPYALGVSSRKKLALLGCPVTWHEYAIPHSVCQAEIMDIQTWLSQRLMSL